MVDPSSDRILLLYPLFFHVLPPPQSAATLPASEMGIGWISGEAEGVLLGSTGPGAGGRDDSCVRLQTP